MASLFASMRRGAIATGALLASGCFLGAYDSAYLEAADVALALPRAESTRDAAPGVYALLGSNAARMNALVGGLVERTSMIAGDLNGLRETRRDGRARVYGPFPDESDPGVVWTVTVRDDDDATEYQVDVGDGTAMRLLEARVEIEGELRSGSFELDLAVLETYPELVESNPPTGTAGRVSGLFVRAGDRDGARRVELEVSDGDEVQRYAFEHDETDAGRMSIVGRLMVPEPFLELEARDAELLARWDDSAAARARGSIAPEAGDDTALPHGALLLDECFDPAGELTFRGVNEAYASVFDGYTLGDPSTCVISEEAL